MGYDYGVLSDYEFEELIRDLMQAGEAVCFETFPEGVIRESTCVVHVLQIARRLCNANTG